ncbi:unnamed protein product, partial [Callosobruchus maculatus]
YLKRVNKFKEFKYKINEFITEIKISLVLEFITENQDKFSSCLSHCI